MKVSIALATYNGENYLTAQLKSFINQTRRPDELVISDDNSTDNTMRIIEEFKKAAPFEVVCYRNKINLGYSANFNAALMKTTGDLVFLSDQDDVWFEEKISQILKLAKTYPDKLLFMNDAAITDNHLNETGLTKLGQIYSRGLNNWNFVTGCCSAIRRDLLDLALPIPDNYKSHDTWIIRLADYLAVKFVSKEVLQYYRRHGENESNAFVNRTTRITKWDLLMFRLKNFLKSPSRSKILNYSLEQQKIFLKGLKRAFYRTNDRYQATLLRVIKLKQEEIDHLKKRKEIRSNTFFSRILSIYNYLINGGYRNSSYIKSILQDLIG